MPVYRRLLKSGTDVKNGFAWFDVETGGGNRIQLRFAESLLPEFATALAAGRHAFGALADANVKVPPLKAPKK